MPGLSSSTRKGWATGVTHTPAHDADRITYDYSTLNKEIEYKKKRTINTRAPIIACSLQESIPSSPPANCPMLMRRYEHVNCSTSRKTRRKRIVVHKYHYDNADEYSESQVWPNKHKQITPLTPLKAHKVK